MDFVQNSEYPQILFRALLGSSLAKIFSFGKIDLSSVKFQLAQETGNETKKGRKKKTATINEETALPDVLFDFGYVDLPTGEYVFVQANFVDLVKKQDDFEVVANLLRDAHAKVVQDLSTITSLNEQAARTQRDSVRRKADAIVQTKNPVGLMFLERFGGVINLLIAENHSLPIWLRDKLDDLYSQVQAIQQDAREQETAARIAVNALEIQVLEQIDNIVCGRCADIKRLLVLLKCGEKLTVPDENTVSRLKAKFSEDNQKRTELLLPFLYFITHQGQSALSPRDRGMLPLLLSFLSQVESGAALSDKQAYIVQEKQKAYFAVFSQQEEPYRLLSSELLSRIEMGDRSPAAMDAATMRKLPISDDVGRESAVNML
jgi:hypothetical protein